MQMPSTLDAHYESKYAGSDFREVSEVPVRRWPRNRFQAAVAALLEKPGGRYLELGAGSGNVAKTLMTSYGEMALTEYANVRVEELRKLFAPSPQVRVHKCDLNSDTIPYTDGYFDAVSLIAVIEHLIDPIAALQEICRVVKPGGRLVIDTPNIAKWTRRIKLLFGYFPSTASLDEGLLMYDRKTPTDLHDEGHLHYFTFRSLGRLATEHAGFQRYEARGYGLPILGKVWPTMFSDICMILHKAS
jgi:ubiquinone/menaquinone biosynthesis C-methylase UbiE